MCFGCSKEPSHPDGSFEYPQHMFWLRNKKNNFQLRTVIWGAALLHAITKAQSGLRLCYSLLEKYDVQTCSIHNFSTLPGLCS